MNICPFSKYKNILGIIEKGVHKYRFLNTAIIDYILTIITACITTYFSNIPLVLTTIMWLILGIILHILFGVQTNTLKYLGIICKS
tara:strand:- start:4418 stop:4675 length:258 start_codon:yes stop_codon:yes gene_type:complete